MEENKKGKHGGEEGEQWHSGPQPPGKLMKAVLSSLYSGVGPQWAMGLGEGRRGSGGQYCLQLRTASCTTNTLHGEGES